MKCPNCQHENADTSKFCENCGHRLAVQPPPPPGDMPVIPGIQSLRSISWAAIDWTFVGRWILFNLLAVLIFFGCLYIVGAIAYQTVLDKVTSYATSIVGGLLGGLLGQTASGFGTAQGGLGGLVALAWLIGLGLIALYGVLVGWAQSGFLRRRLVAINWGVVSTAGAFMATVAVYLLWRIGLRNSFFMLVGAAAGFSGAQWYALRSHVASAWIWIAGNVAAGIVLWIFLPLIQAMVGSTFAGGAVDLLSGDVSGLVLSVLVPSLIFGALAAGVTGITMNYIFQKVGA